MSPLPPWSIPAQPVPAAGAMTEQQAVLHFPPWQQLLLTAPEPIPLRLCGGFLTSVCDIQRHGEATTAAATADRGTRMAVEAFRGGRDPGIRRLAAGHNWRPRRGLVLLPSHPIFIAPVPQARYCSPRR